MTSGTRTYFTEVYKLVSGYILTPTEQAVSLSPEPKLEHIMDSAHRFGLTTMSTLFASMQNILPSGSCEKNERRNLRTVCAYCTDRNEGQTVALELPLPAIIGKVPRARQNGQRSA